MISLKSLNDFSKRQTESQFNLYYNKNFTNLNITNSTSNLDKSRESELGV